MKGNVKIITNNPLVKENMSEKHEVHYIGGNAREVFIEARNNVHVGHELLTHPLMSSIKPNETPYRTVCLSRQKVSGCDMKSIMLMEQCVSTMDKFLNDADIPQYSEQVQDDFKLIDYDLIKNALS